MNPRPEQALLEEIALVKGIDAPFIEKDWFVTQVIQLIAELPSQDIEVVFSGGTALSKAHHLLQRFSEDIDFRLVVPPAQQNRRRLSAFKQAVATALRSGGFALRDDQIKAGDGNRFIALELDYASYFSQADALRPHILIELTASDIALPCVYRTVSSFVHAMTGRPPEVQRIGCLDPVESAGDKLSALTWRIPDRQRGQVGDDPAIVRHLHDLAILQNLALTNTAFPKLVMAALTKDDQRAKHSASLAGQSAAEKFQQMLTILENDGLYVKEYDRFVKGVSYANADEIPDFAQALQAVRALTQAVLSPTPPQ